MPGIPAMSRVNVTMVLGAQSPLTNPASVFLVYGNISSLQPGYIYMLDATVSSGIITIYNPSSAGPYVYIADGSAWYFTPNANPTSNGCTANFIGILSGYLSIAVPPSGQYLVGATPSWGEPFQGTYQPTPLTGTYGIAYTPQSVLNALSGLGAAYVTPLVNPPTLSGYTLPILSTKPYFIQLPQCSISSNPYGGGTGTYGLLNCLAINNGGVWAVIRFYYAPGDEGGLLGFIAYQYPNTVITYTPPLVSIVNNGDFYFGAWYGG